MYTAMLAMLYPQLPARPRVPADEIQATFGDISERPGRLCSHHSGRGAHQFQRPSSAISDGTRNALTVVASTITRAAMPLASSLMKMICDVANAPIATQNRSATLTII